MELLDCLCVKHSQEEKTELERVLGVAKSVMAITMPMPTVNWIENNGSTVIFGATKEISVMKLVLQNNLGIFKEDETNPFDEPLTTPVASGVTTNAPCVLEDVPCERDTLIANSAAMYTQCMAPSALDTEGNPDLNVRRMVASSENSLVAVWTGHYELPTIDFTNWLDFGSRLHENPNPTESSSGSISRDEQIRFSELQNPRHWNIVKVSFNGSRYYLSYICPPSANIHDTLRIVGGIHAEDTPEIQEICVYNNEPYWRELRHMMHQQVTAVREAVVA